MDFRICFVLEREIKIILKSFIMNWLSIILIKRYVKGFNNCQCENKPLNDIKNYKIEDQCFKKCNTFLKLKIKNVKPPTYSENIKENELTENELNQNNCNTPYNNYNQNNCNTPYNNYNQNNCNTPYNNYNNYNTPFNNYIPYNNYNNIPYNNCNSFYNEFQNINCINLLKSNLIDEILNESSISDDSENNNLNKVNEDSEFDYKIDDKTDNNLIEKMVLKESINIEDSFTLPDPIQLINNTERAKSVYLTSRDFFEEQYQTVKIYLKRSVTMTNELEKSIKNMKDSIEKTKNYIENDHSHHMKNFYKKKIQKLKKEIILKQRKLREIRKWQKAIKNGINTHFI
ncbi:hypothetical protein A0H76_1408 [Hepatospora eriocheir]|uniref:Uncharacterized protein n=1 Tax=Hepatospora eriocheir TaxID=1081669 RepID=A0A1X0QH32_9MICR|nr:hypothetical protein A0H76_1408 [Hepatospora eriocheir]